MKMKAGMMDAAPSAAMLPQAVPIEVTKVDETTGTVLSDVVVRVSAKRNSVQLKMKQRTAVAAMPPLAIGSTIRRKIMKRLAPSTIALSSISEGMSSKKLFIRRTASGRF